MSRTKAAFKGIISSQIFMVISIAVNIFSTPFIVHHLSSEIYGLSIIIFQIVAYMSMFDFGMDSGMVRFLAGARGDSIENKQRVQTILSTSFVVYAVIGLLVALLGVFLAPFVPRAFNISNAYAAEAKSIIYIISVLVGFQFLLRSISGIFFAHQRQLLSNTLGFITGIGNTVFVILFISAGYQLWSFIYAQICVFIINAILCISFFIKYYKNITISWKNFDGKLLKEMLSFGFFLFLNGIAVQVVFQTDRIMVGSLISLTAVSIYSLTTRLPEILSQLVWKIGDNALPAMVELSKDRSESTFKEIHDNIMQLTMSLSTILLWIIVLVSFPFLKLWVGEQYFAGMGFTLIVSFLFLILHTFLHVTAGCLTGAGFAKGFSIMSLFDASINIILTIFLGKTFGITGIVLATIIAGFLTSGWYVPFLAIKFMKSSVFSYVYVVLKPIIVCSIFGIGAYLLFRNTFYTIANWLQLVMYTLALSIFLIIPFCLLNYSVVERILKRVSSR